MKLKSGVDIGPMVCVEEPKLVATTKSETEGLEKADGIEDDSVSGSGWSSLCSGAIRLGETSSISTVVTGKSPDVACC